LLLFLVVSVRNVSAARGPPYHLEVARLSPPSFLSELPFPNSNGFILSICLKLSFVSLGFPHSQINFTFVDH
jgi:hypothetical protein